MEAERRSSPAHKPKFLVYQNPTFSAALTATSIRPSPTTLLLLFFSSLASSLFLLALSSREKFVIQLLTKIHLSITTALLVSKVLQAAAGVLSLAIVSALIKALSLRNPKIASKVASSPKKPDEKQQSSLSERQLGLLGLKPKPPEQADTVVVKKPPKSRALASMQVSEPLVPIRKSPFSYTPSRQSRIGSDERTTNATKKAVIPLESPPSAPPLPKYMGSPSTPWSKHSSGSAKGIQTEKMLEQFLAEVDEKIEESAVNEAATPSPTIRGFAVVSPGSIASSATPSGAARSTPLRPVRMSPGSHQKYSTPPKKGEGELPLPMTVEQVIEAFVCLGVYPQIEQWRDRLRQWLSSILINPLLEKIETSHIQVMQAAATVGISISVDQVGGDSLTIAAPDNASPVDGPKEWLPTFSLDEDGLLHQLRAALLHARDASATHSPLASMQQSPQNPQLPVIQACLDAITEHQRLKVLMKGELIKGLLPQSSVRADYTVKRVRELAEGTCLKNYDFLGSGDGPEKADKWRIELPTDPHLLLYLVCAFLEHPRWMLHVDPTSYSGAQSSKNPLFLGILPPKDRFPEKYVAVISGVPSVIHPGACILSLGKQSPPVLALYWDKKLQFSLQGRTALWDALLLLFHRIKVRYGGVVRGVHLGSSAFNLLPVLDSNTES